MGAAVDPKLEPKSEAAQLPSMPAKKGLSAVEPDHVATVSEASPARALIAELEARVSEPRYTLSMRDVTVSVIVFCLAAWWALYLAVTAIV